MKEMKDFSKISHVSETVLREFAEANFPPIEIQANGMMTIAMDARYQVTMVSLQNVDMEPSLARRLEQAIQEAVNDAVLEVCKRKGEQLIAALERDLQK